MILNKVEDTLTLVSRQRALVRQSSLHVVRPELTGGDLALCIEDGAFTLAQVIGPLTVVDRVSLRCVVAATPRSLTIDPKTC